MLRLVNVLVEVEAPFSVKRVKFVHHSKSTFYQTTNIVATKFEMRIVYI